MKKFTSLLLSICFTFMLLSFTINAAETSQDYTSSSTQSSVTKSTFAKQAKEDYAKQAVHTELSDEEVSELLLLYRETGDNQYEEALNNAGIYLYSSATSLMNYPTNSNARATSSADVIMNTCEVLHNTSKNQWEIRFVGKWKSITPISDEVHVWFNPSVGSTMHVGGYDAVGIILYETSGPSPTKLDSYATLRSSDKKTSTTSENPDTHDDSKGVAFSIQDYIICTKKTSMFTYEWDHVGAIFETTMIFDSSFENFHGKAKGHYAHTWNSASITSIGVGWPSFDMSWIPENNAFGCFSDAAATF